MKKITLIIFTIFIFLLNPFIIKAEDLEIYSKYAILYNLDNDTILFEKK